MVDKLQQLREVVGEDVEEAILMHVLIQYHWDINHIVNTYLQSSESFPYPTLANVFGHNYPQMKESFHHYDVELGPGTLGITVENILEVCALSISSMRVFMEKILIDLLANHHYLR